MIKYIKILKMNLRLFIVVSMLFLFSLQTIVIAADTTPPEIQEIYINPEVGSLDDLISIMCKVTDNGGLHDVRVHITGPSGLDLNDSMEDWGGGYFGYLLYGPHQVGIYILEIWADDNSGNSVDIDGGSVQIVKPISYVHVDASYNIGPFDGTEAHPFNKISHGIGAVKPGGTVFVHEGVYEYVWTNKSLILEGESKKNTIIEGNTELNYAVKFEAENVKIKSFTIRNSIGYGIDLNSQISEITNNLIDNCEIYDNEDGGIRFSSSVMCSDNTISNCLIHDNVGSGIELSNSIDTSILNCEIYNNENDGIYGLSSSSIVTDCNISDNNQNGIRILASENFEISTCNIFGNSQGVYIQQSSNNNLLDCNIYDNYFNGIGISSDSHNNKITDCDINNNNECGTRIYETSPNVTGTTIYHNNFYDNAVNAQDNAADTIWDDGTYGNYWDDYQELYPDATIDLETGTWSIPYDIEFGAMDLHPWVSLDGIIDEESPVVSVISPNGGEIVSGNTLIEWAAQDTYSPDSSLDISFLFSPDNGLSWETVSNDLENTGSYLWDTTTIQNTDSGLIKISSEDVFGNIGTDISDDIFIVDNSNPTLVISAPSIVIEESNFLITIIVDNLTIDEAQVTFNKEIKVTNSEGEVTFTAPDVDSDRDLLILAKHADYSSASKTIKITNKDETTNTGFIYGTITDGTSPLEDVKISISNDQKSWVIYTDENGGYYDLFPVGTYSVQASLYGYQTDIKHNIKVTENTAIDANFILEKKTGSSDEDKGLIEFIVESQIKDKLGGEVDTTKEESNVILYSSDLDIQLIESNKLSEGVVNVKISGESDEGKFFIFYLSGVEDINDISLEYDGNVIEKSNDFVSFFSSDNTENSWILLQTENIGECVLIFYNSDFSEHSIIISSIIKVIDVIGITTIYIAFIIIASIVFVTRFIARPIYLSYLHKKK